MFYKMCGVVRGQIVYLVCGISYVGELDVIVADSFVV